MKINYKLLPVKIHYFLFMAASGAMLPFLQVMGKQLGISEVVMGSVTALLPPLFLLAKPLFGILADHFSAQRRIIFLFVLAGQNIAYGFLYFIPNIQESNSLSLVNSSYHGNHSTATSHPLISSSAVYSDYSAIVSQKNLLSNLSSLSESFPPFSENLNDTISPEVQVQSASESLESNLYASPGFWIFVALLSIGTVFFNVANSVSDAITFDILGEGCEMSYGTQRVWGTIGFGLAALLAGFGMEFWSPDDSINKNYTPAIVIAIIFCVIDLVVCYYYLNVGIRCVCRGTHMPSQRGAEIGYSDIKKVMKENLIKMPLMPRSNRILRDVGRLICHRKVAVFLIFAAICGVLDGFIIYYLFWYLEDIAVSTNHTSSIKILEGLVVAAETLIGETIFFYISGLLLKWLGNSDGEHSYARALTLSLISFATRFALISFVSHPWWMLPIEAVMQGPTYALSYTAIVGYAAVISPPGASSTMQGLVAGVDDGLGYALGSLIGGVLYRYMGGKAAFQVFAGVAAISAAIHHVLYECYLKNKKSEANYQVKYKTPREAVEDTATAETPDTCCMKESGDFNKELKSA